MKFDFFITHDSKMKNQDIKDLTHSKNASNEINHLKMPKILFEIPEKRFLFCEH